MGDVRHHIHLRVVNNPTVLTRVIQVIKRRCININWLVAVDESACEAQISLNITATNEQTRLVKSQLVKLIDVMNVQIIWNNDSVESTLYM
jgi:acetolactate synthase small subunit